MWFFSIINVLHNSSASFFRASQKLAIAPSQKGNYKCIECVITDWILRFRMSNVHCKFFFLYSSVNPRVCIYLMHSKDAILMSSEELFSELRSHHWPSPTSFSTCSVFPIDVFFFVLLLFTSYLCSSTFITFFLFNFHWTFFKYFV